MFESLLKQKCHWRLKTTGPLFKVLYISCVNYGISSWDSEIHILPREVRAGRELASCYGNRKSSGWLDRPFGSSTDLTNWCLEWKNLDTFDIIKANESSGWKFPVTSCIYYSELFLVSHFFSVRYLLYYGISSWDSEIHILPREVRAGRELASCYGNRKSSGWLDRPFGSSTDLTNWCLEWKNLDTFDIIKANESSGWKFPVTSCIYYSELFLVSHFFSVRYLL